MMQEILYLESDEEITSVIDKIRGLPGDSVSLVLPKHASLAASVVNLRLLWREAKKLKKSIAIVTQDKIGVKLASQVGIPVYGSITDDIPITADTGPKPQVDDVIEFDEPELASSGKEPGSSVPVKRYDEQATATPPLKQQSFARSDGSSPARSRSGPLTPRSKMAAVIAGTFVFAVGAWVLSQYPKATLILALQSTPYEQAVSVVVDNSLDAPQVDQGGVPGQTVEAQAEAKETFDATGKKNVGTKASGKVTVTNRLGESVTLVSGARFERDGLAFLSKSEVVVPKATADVDTLGNPVVKPGTATVDVEAGEAGDQYNLSAGDFVITSLTGTKREKVTATNSAKITGGESKTLTTLAEADLETAKKKIIELRTEELVNSLKDKAKDLTILPNAVLIEVVESSANHAVGDETANFELTAKVRARTIGFLAREYQDVLVGLVAKTVPIGKELAVTPEDAVETKVERQEIEQGKLVLQTTMHTKIIDQFDEDTLRMSVSGLTVIEAETLLNEQPGVTDATVTLQPSFLGRVPKQDRKIRLEIRRE